MARDNRKFNRTVRLSGGKGDAVRLFNEKQGNHDELAAALTPEQGQKFIESGAIAGDWKFTADVPQPAVPSTPPQEDVAALKARIAELEAAAATAVKEPKSPKEPKPLTDPPKE